MSKRKLRKVNIQAVLAAEDRADGTIFNKGTMNVFFSVPFQWSSLIRHNLPVRGQSARH